MTVTRTTTPLIVETAALGRSTFDIYRDIHKGIRDELFARHAGGGQVDPARPPAALAAAPSAGATSWRAARRPRRARGRRSCSP